MLYSLRITGFLAFLSLILLGQGTTNQYRQLQTISPSEKQYLELCAFVNEEQGLSSVEFKVFDTFNQYRHSDDKTYFEDALKSGSFSGAYYIGRHFLEIIAVPFSLSFFLFFFFWIHLSCVCCRCCIHKCPKCRRDPLKKPYSPGQISCPIIWSAILGLVIFLVSIFGNQTNTEFVQAYDFSLCQLTQLHKEAVFGLGNSTYTWTGTSAVTSQVNSISSNLASLYSSISNTFGSNVAFASSGEIEAQLTTISNLFSTTSQQTINKDPVNGNSLQVPYFGQIGSASVSSSKVGVLETQRASIFGTNLTAIVNLKTKAEVVSGNSSLINSAFTSTASSLTQLQTDVSKDGSDFFHQYREKQTQSDLLKLFSFGYFITVSIFLCVISIGVMLVKVCGIPCCRALIHVGWIAFAWLAIIGFLLTALTIIARFAMQDFCETEATLITSSNIAQVNVFKLSAPYFNDCLDSSTNPTMADNLQIDTSLTLLSELNTQNAAFPSTYTTAIAANAYTTLTSLVSEVDGHIASPNLLLKTENGVASSKSWNQAMTNLKTTANSDCSSQSANEEFVYKASECPGTHTLNANLGQAACIELHNFQTSTNTRYNGCTNSGSNIKTLIQRAQDSVGEVLTKLNSLKSELDSTGSSTDLKDKFESVRSSRQTWLSSKYSGFNSLVTSTSGAVYLSTNSATGLVGQFQCGWLGTRYDAFSKAFCTESKYNYGTVVVLVFVVSVLCFLLSCCGGCMAIRIAAELKQKRKYHSFSLTDRKEPYLEENSADKMSRF